MNKGEYKYLNTLRAILCIAILLYHLNYLKGGFLAVCSFFALSGYLTTVSSLDKEHFSIKEYYKKRFIRLYLPLVIVLFGTIAVLHFTPSIVWLNIKKEVISILLGYNNFWQLSINSNYFAMSSTSPFTHLWYIGILFQFELIFPIAFKIIKRLGEKVDSKIPVLTTGIASILSIIFFFVLIKQGNIMGAYYNTFARLYSLLFGVLLAIIHTKYKPKVLKKEKFKRYAMYFYLLIFILSYFLINAESNLFAISMIITSLLTCRFIDYAISIKNNTLKVHDRAFKQISTISYLVYLLQYPLIYLLAYVKTSEASRSLLIVLLVFVLSVVINFALGVNKTRNSSKKMKQVCTLLVVLLTTAFGIYSYFVYEDHSEEMKKLEEQMNENQELMLQKQKEYEERLKAKEQELNENLNEIDNQIENIEDYVANLNVVGIGDSVMLGAVNNLYKIFPNGYFDAKVSRRASVVNDMLLELIGKKALGEVIVINLGANGDCSEKCKDEIMTTIGPDREVFWLTVTNDAKVHFNDKIKKFAEKYDNLHILDWEDISSGHEEEYFYGDGIHLKIPGRKAYAEAVYQAICELYKVKLQDNKEELKKQHEEEQQQGLEFYGNELLLNVYNYISEDFKDAKFNINKDYDYQTLLFDLKDHKKDLKDNVIFAFDEVTNIDFDKYKEIIGFLSDKQIYIVSLNRDLTQNLKDLNNKNVHVLDLSKISQDSYLSDRIHLSEKGNGEFKELLLKQLKKEGE